RAGRTYRCPRGHSFDVARSGYLNLLQPQERRSRHPGDSREAALARRRLFAAGHFDPLLAAIAEAAAEAVAPSRRQGSLPAVLDVGCGEGSVLGALAGSRELEAWGVYISTGAIDLAARAHPDLHWLVANADRTLPFPARSFALLPPLPPLRKHTPPRPR